MKTYQTQSIRTKDFSQVLRTGMAIAILLGALLFMASCKKETVQPLAQVQTATENAKQANPQHFNSFIAFKSISIDHRALHSNLPDYRITVYDNGTAWYDGRKNVHIHGNREIEVSEQAMKRINGLFLQYISIGKPIKEEYENAEMNTRGMFHPIVITSFESKQKGLNGQFIDNDNGQPVWLVTFRTEVEKALDITKLIGNGATLHAEVNE